MRTGFEEWFGQAMELKLFSFGFNLAIIIAIQIISGIVISWTYSNEWNKIFETTYYSVSNYEIGCMVRAVHITGTSVVYAILYVHIFKVLYLAIIFDLSMIVWTIGMIIFILLIIIAFLGYVLPMSQMSYWGLTVFSNILSAIPVVGNIVVTWLWGSEFICNESLIKIHTIHIVMPMVTILVILAHIIFLHHFLSSDAIDRYSFYIERIGFTLETQLFL
jgi:quinol-cytochrome oxidoreductase complex cytochrome b subunit